MNLDKKRKIKKKQPHKLTIRITKNEIPLLNSSQIRTWNLIKRMYKSLIINLK